MGKKMIIILGVIIVAEVSDRSAVIAVAVPSSKSSVAACK